MFKKIKLLMTISKLAKEIEIGVPTMMDIVAELVKPGRDIREEAELQDLIYRMYLQHLHEVQEQELFHKQPLQLLNQDHR